MDYTGAVYPLNTPGVQQQNNGNPLFGGFSGIDFGSLDAHLDSELGRAKQPKEEKEPKSRDVQGRGNWVYRQFEDGSIQIVVSGHPSLPVGDRITAQSHPRQWNAITAEIGTWQQFIKDRWAKRGQTALTLLEAGGKVAEKAKGRKKRRRRRSAPMPDALPEPLTVEEESEGLPSWVLPAVMGTILIGGLIYAVTQQSAPKSGRG
jgi:hypothetical protein